MTAKRNKQKRNNRCEGNYVLRARWVEESQNYREVGLFQLPWFHPSAPFALYDIDNGKLLRPGIDLDEAGEMIAEAPLRGGVSYEV